MVWSMKTEKNSISTEGKEKSMFKLPIGEYDKLVIYGNGRKLLEKTRDFTKLGEFKDDKVTEHYFDRLLSINLLNEPKNARKENLERKDNYTLSFKKSWGDTGVAIYIHETEIAVEELGEYVSMEANGEKDYLYGYRLHFMHGAEGDIYNVERMYVPKDWTLPRGSDWSGYGCRTPRNCYEIVDEERQERLKEIAEIQGKPYEPCNLLHKWYEYKPVTETVMSSETYHRSEKTAERLERERLAELMNSVVYGNKFSHYDIENLLKVVDIKAKVNA